VPGANMLSVVAPSQASTLDSLSTEVRAIDPRATTDYESRRTQLRTLDEQAKDFGPAANSLRCDIGKRVATMSAYAGDLDSLRKWAQASIDWAESVDEWGYCAELYAMLAVSPLGSTIANRVDALIHAHQIRSTRQMDDEQGSAVDNTIGAAFSNLGLLDEAQQRWQWSLDRYHECNFPGVALSAINLNDLRLYLLENPHLRDIDDAPEESTLTHIDRFNEILAQNPHCPADVVAALRCRARLFRGDIDGARSILNNVAHPPTNTMSWIQVLYAKGKVAQASGDAEAFVEVTSLLLARIGEHPVFIHLERAAQRLRVDALLMAGDIDPARELLSKLEGRDFKVNATKLATLFEWVRVQSEPGLPTPPSSISPRGRISRWEFD